jgi:outer membrane lipoprotein SlyB
MAEALARIPVGTSLQVRITESLNSETSNVGQIFHGTLEAPIVVHGKTLFPKGADVTGEVINVERSGRLSNPGELHLSLRTIRNGKRTYALSVEPIFIKGESHAKSNVTKIGGGAALGALIGAIAGGGKGAAIGAGVGAAAGTGVAAGTGTKAAEVRSETLLAWVVQDPSAQPTVVQAPAPQAPIVETQVIQEQAVQAPPAYEPYPPPPPVEEAPRQYRDEREFERHDDARHDDDRRDEGRRDDDRRDMEAREYERHEAEEREHHDERYAHDDYQRDNDARRWPTGFTEGDRHVINDCFEDNRASLPPGLARRDRLPHGLERQLERNGTLPPGLERRVQPLPRVCTSRLPRLPRDWERVVLSGRIILLDPQRTIVDLFWLGRD